GKLAAVTIFLGFNLTFFPQFILGYLGMPRRYWEYPPEFQVWNVLSTAGASILAVGYLLPMVYMIWSLRYGKIAGDNPWGAAGLEWTTQSPPITSNFEVTPEEPGKPTTTTKSPPLRRFPLADTSALATQEHEHSDLQHHFADMEQQKEASTLGMWVFLGTINAMVLICSSLTVALGVKAAQRGKRKLLIVLIILTLIFGLGFLGIKGIEWYQKYQEHHVPGISFNISDIQHAHPQTPLNPGHAQLYFSLYFALTGLHALHMIIGIGIFLALLWMAWKGRFGPDYYTPMEIGGLYWHFVDIVWIYLFPLLYLIDRKHIP